MPTADPRPRILDVKYRPGAAYTIAFTGPAGWLADRAFTATLAGTALTVTEDDDRLLLAVPSALTTANGVNAGAVPFTMTEVGGNVVLVGSWKPSLAGAPSGSTLEFDVVLAGPEVEVELVVGPIGAGVHSVVEGHGVDIDLSDPTDPVIAVDESELAVPEANVVGLTAALAGKQPLDADLTALASAGNSSVLAATTATFLLADETKLDGIALGATANQADAILLARANHTGTQAIATVTGLQAALDVVTATPLTSGLPGYVYGHSWAASDTYNTVGNRWWQQLRRRLGLGNVESRAVAGSTSHFMASTALGGAGTAANAWTVGTKGLVLVHVGGNEQVNTDATVAAVAAMLQLELKSLVAYLGADSATIVQGAAMTAVGSWTNFGYTGASAGNYSYTTTANDTLTGTISGDKINLHYMTFDGVLFHGREFEVRVDGVLKATVNPESMVSVAAWGSNHGGVGHGVLELTGLGVGSHSVEVKATATLGGGAGTPAYVGVDCLTTPSTTPPLVVLVVDPRIASYATAPERAAILTQAQAVASGRAHVLLADVDTGWVGNTWLGADAIHPLDVGEAHVATRVADTLLEYVTAGGAVPWGSTGATTLSPTDLPVTDGGTGASDAATARSNLGLGTIATQAASAVAITGGTVTGITDLAVADGGTGASTALAARSNLGLVLGTDIYSKAAVDSGFQPLDADLTAIAALTTAAYGRGLLTFSSQTTLAGGLAVDAAFTARYAAKENPNGLGLGPVTFDPAMGFDLNSTTNANRALYFRVADGGTISKIGLSVANQSGNICVGVYANSGTGRASVPGARKATSGSVACPTGGYSEVSLGGSVTVDPGDWLAYVPDNATCRIVGVSAGGVAANNSYAGRSAFQDTAFPLPASATPTNGLIKGVILIGVA